jgi:hypothetical protein
VRRGAVCRGDRACVMIPYTTGGASYRAQHHPGSVPRSGPRADAPCLAGAPPWPWGGGKRPRTMTTPCCGLRLAASIRTVLVAITSVTLCAPWAAAQTPAPPPCTLKCGHGGSTSSSVTPCHCNCATGFTKTDHCAGTYVAFAAAVVALSRAAAAKHALWLLLWRATAGVGIVHSRHVRELHLGGGYQGNT